MKKLENVLVSTGGDICSNCPTPVCEVGQECCYNEVNEEINTKGENKMLKVEYVNMCIRNAVKNSKKDNKHVESLLSSHIMHLYFSLTGVVMSDKQKDYIENITNAEAWSILRCLKYLDEKKEVLAHA